MFTVFIYFFNIEYLFSLAFINAASTPFPDPHWRKIKICKLNFKVSNYKKLL